MKIKFGTPLNELNGKPVIADGQPVTIGDQVVLALTVTEQGVEGPEKMRRGLLAQKIYGQDEVEITIEEAALIKELVGKYLSVLAVTQIWQILESGK